MSPSSLEPVKAMQLARDAGKTTRFAANLLGRNDGRHSLRKDLAGFAAARDIQR